MFGAVMSKPEFCKPLLERIIGLKIRKIEYISRQETLEADSEAHGVRLDIYVESDEETIYNVEMQTSIRSYSPKRIRYYQDMIDINQIIKGKSYDSLKKCLVIFVCTFDPFGMGLPMYTFRNTCLENASLYLNDETEKIILNTKGINGILSRDLENLLKYIDTGEPSDAYTEALDAEVHAIRSNEKWRVRYMTLSLKYMDLERQAKEEGHAAGHAEGLAEGRAEGRAEGLTEGKAQSVLVLLSDLGEVPDEIKHKITDEKDTNRLNQYLKCAAKASSMEDFLTAIQVS
jgi:predicted transposase/invertase (TIGR01784 family)